MLMLYKWNCLLSFACRRIHEDCLKVGLIVTWAWLMFSLSGYFYLRTTDMLTSLCKIVTHLLELHLQLTEHLYRTAFYNYWLYYFKSFLLICDDCCVLGTSEIL